MGQKQYYSVKLTSKERTELLQKIHRGKGSASEIRRAHILLKADRSQKKKWLDREIAEALDVSLRTVQSVRRKFCERGVQVIKHPKVPGRPKIVDGDVEANIIAIALSDPPKGRVHWTLRLIAGRLVELHIVPQISHHTVGRVLKKKNLNLG
jgi:transposase